MKNETQRQAGRKPSTPEVFTMENPRAKRARSHYVQAVEGGFDEIVSINIFLLADAKTSVFRHRKIIWIGRDR